MFIIWFFCIIFISRKGTVVTYGGMSRHPISFPTGPLIFNDICLRGFWLSRWVQEHSEAERKAMLAEITKLVENKQLVFLLQTFKFGEYKRALEAALDPMPLERRKIVLTM